MAKQEKRKCGRCRRNLASTAFARQSTGYQSYCRDCQKEYDAAWYQANKSRRKAKVRVDRQRYLAWLDGLKDGKPCADCGGVYPSYVMEWDHLPGVEKTLVLGNTRGSAYGKERILAEIAELVCANCHRVRTFGGRGREAA